MRSVLITLIACTGSVLGQPLLGIPSYHCADSVARLYPDHSLYELKSLTDKLTGPLRTDVEKFRAIYMWVCLNIETNYDLYVKVKSKRARYRNDPQSLSYWNKKHKSALIEILFTNNQTICTGYSYLIREMALMADIPCEVVDGFSRQTRLGIRGSVIPNHSWNAVRLNNQWYLCDATWSSGIIEGSSGKFIPRYSDAWFLTDPQDFLRDHYPQDTLWLLTRDHSTLNAFLGR
jgi:transglutaminase/protease-like cytokinesis protein 3